MKTLYILMLVLAFTSGCRMQTSQENQIPDKPTTSVPEEDPKPEEKSGRVVVAYVTSWTDEIPVAERVTHINYAFGHVNDSFNGIRIDNEARLRRLVRLKENHTDLKVMLSIGGWGSGRFSEMAASETYRKMFAADCERVVKEYGLDGIDIDWEYPTSSSAGISSSPQDTDNYTLLMKDIRDAIGEDKELTLASASNAGYIDFKAILEYVDFVNIMAYDMGYAPEHNSALFRKDSQGNTSPVAGWVTTEEAVQAHLKAGIPAEKLVLGMPFYGRGDSSYGDFVDYKDITGPKDGHKEIWDDIAKVPYYCDNSGTLVLGFENVRSISIKCDYIIEKGLLGAMYWDYSGDNEKGDLSKEIASKIL